MAGVLMWVPRMFSCCVEAAVIQRGWLVLCVCMLVFVTVCWYRHLREMHQSYAAKMQKLVMEWNRHAYVGLAGTI